MTKKHSNGCCDDSAVETGTAENDVIVFDSDTSIPQTSLNLFIEVDGVEISDDFEPLFHFMSLEAGVVEGHVVEVVLAESSKMIALKKEHFSIEMDTDVIAFPVDVSMMPPGVPAMAGELFLGVSQILRNSKESGYSFSREFLFVLAHGLLHINGWDDGTDEDREAMFCEQRRILTMGERAGYSLDDVITWSKESEQV